MLARRFVAGYVGSAAIPPALYTLSSTEPGFLWAGVVDPVAITYAGVTYFGGVDPGVSGDIYLGSFDWATRTANATITVATGYSSPSGNSHNSITLAIRSSDQRLLIVMASEGIAKPVARLSVNPVTSDPSLSGGFGSPYSISTSGVYSWGSLYELTSESKFYLWLISWTGGVGRLAYMTSSDDGATWSGPTSVVSPVTTPTLYYRIGSNGTSRFDIFVTSTFRDESDPASLYHLYMTGGQFYKTDGTLISASQPFVASAGSLVQDASLGTIWCDGWAYDGSGRPCALWGAMNGTTALRYQGRWTGSAWSVHVVGDPGGTPNPYPDGRTIALAALEKDNPDAVYLPTVVSGLRQMYRYVSSDHGVTWTGTQLTSGAVENDYADTPWCASGLRGLWAHLDGTIEGWG